MEQNKSQAVRAAGIGCLLMLILIAFALIKLPTEQVMDYLTIYGKLGWARYDDRHSYALYFSPTYWAYVLLDLEMANKITVL